MLDFTSFKASLKGDGVTPEHPEYESAIGRWSKSAQRNAQIVAFVKDEQDVALCIQYARENKLHFAIKGGGHSTAGNSSSEGVVIDLSRYINSVEVDAEKMVVYVGGGATWEAVDKATTEKGLATVGGIVNHTGVGGLTLGGGFGYLTGEHGLVIDNLVQATVVVADGSTLIASETENPDLFFGIRGGGCNFGVVTQFVFKVYPQKKTVFVGKFLFSFEQLEELLAVTEKWWETVEDKEALFHGLTAESQRPMIKTVVFYNGSENEGRKKFKSFYELKPIGEQSGEIPYVELNTQFNDSTEFGKCRLMKGAFFVKPKLEVIKKALLRIAELNTEEHDFLMLFEHIPFKKSLSVPNGTAAFYRTETSNAVIITSWKNNTAENLAIARRITRELNAIIVAGGREELGPANCGYGNYDQDGSCEAQDLGVTKNNAEVLFDDNYPKMQEIKKKYDPENIFANWFAITPAP